ncbi:hypothetical protein GJ744_002278 [Endocarpon pusillum]|uniref:F-box domain-containing protein n=1 Tax=Endocarpon pusillum TaxID=364733 RepID=A0A8H7AS01_9EURO|nr:hypothetical protein GJ744_002278 [Endocarpon pusillum]
MHAIAQEHAEQDGLPNSHILPRDAQHHRLAPGEQQQQSTHLVVDGLLERIVRRGRGGGREHLQIRDRGEDDFKCAGQGGKGFEVEEKEAVWEEGYLVIDWTHFCWLGLVNYFVQEVPVLSALLMPRRISEESSASNVEEKATDAQPSPDEQSFHTRARASQITTTTNYKNFHARHNDVGQVTTKSTFSRASRQPAIKGVVLIVHTLACYAPLVNQSDLTSKFTVHPAAMPSLQDLPPELLEVVASYLAQADLVAMAQTCTHINKACIPTLYKVIVLDDDGCEILTDCLILRFDLAQLVRSISFDLELHYADPFADEILPLLPNLQYLSFFAQRMDFFDRGHEEDYNALGLGLWWPGPQDRIPSCVRKAASRIDTWLPALKTSL